MIRAEWKSFFNLDAFPNDYLILNLGREPDPILSFPQATSDNARRLNLLKVK